MLCVRVYWCKANSTFIIKFKKTTQISIFYYNNNVTSFIKYECGSEKQDRFVEILRLKCVLMIFT